MAGFARVQLGRTMATITDAALCDDPARKAGAIAFGFMVQQATSSAYPFIQAKVRRLINLYSVTDSQAKRSGPRLRLHIHQYER